MQSIRQEVDVAHTNTDDISRSILTQKPQPPVLLSIRNEPPMFIFRKSSGGLDQCSEGATTEHEGVQKIM